MAELLRTRGLSFGYDRRALTAPIDLNLHAGEIVVVLGPNGSGKSTLFRTLLGAVAPLSGTVHWGERTLVELGPRELALRVAWVPQQPGAAFEFSVEQYVMLGRLGRLAPGAAPGRADREAVTRAIERLGLAHFRSRSLSRMSGGERQLAAIARALAQQASTLLLDEPTASLDFGNQGRVLDTLRSLAADGLGIAYATHDPNHALRAGTHTLVYLPDGAIAFGSIGNLIEPDMLTRVYGVQVEAARTRDGRPVFALAAAAAPRGVG
ncbi:MAG: ABC transporter ATP-binding protein [Burkholderiaceae bacterium]|jgi:iron complex transport system ATP-binding protein|nr:ABC transporter ATP-binding protein [Burkholderiaceae bacterium]MEB2351944.1 ABC transporter ATP-binding protein [Burkholderiaceae bacterium]